MLGFRALQALMDLRAAAGRQPQEAIRGIVDFIPPAERQNGHDSHALARVILRQGGRLERPADARLIDALRLAASQPAQGTAAFACATALLLSDRIQMGLSDDDLGAHWEAFHTDYATLPAHDRAAIVQGFMAASALGRARFDATQIGQSHVTDPREAVLADLLVLIRRGLGALSEAVARDLDPTSAALGQTHLEALSRGDRHSPLTGDSLIFPTLLKQASAPAEAAHVAAVATVLAEAILSGDAEGWFAITLWAEQIRDWIALEPQQGRPILAGLRHLYESNPDWSPMPERLVSPRGQINVPLLPVLDASYGHPGPGPRIG